jgi:hypothetical protein
LFEQFRALREQRLEENPIDITRALTAERGGIGTPEDMRKHLRKFEEVGVDQVTFIQQAGMNKHEHICESLELFGTKVTAEFKEREIARELKKAEELAPFIAAAKRRKKYMRPLADEDIPVFPALGHSLVESEAGPNKATDS